MTDVFISYSRDDQAIARLYAEALQREGLAVWWDVALNPGETFDKVTEQALREARAVIVLWSKRSVESRWVRSEATQADRYGTLVPVSVEPCERPIMFELAHTADLAGWTGDTTDPRWLTLRDSVQRKVSGTAPPAIAAEPAIAGSRAAGRAPVAAKLTPRMLWGAIAAAVVVVAAAVVITLKPGSEPGSPAQLMRFNVRFAGDVHYIVGEDFARSASISPDGRKIIFTGNNATTGIAQLYIRMVDSEMIVPVEGSVEGTEPFWSPDSESVGFYSRGKVKIASLAGDPVRDLADAPATGGASWNGHGQVLASLSNPGPLMLLPAAGGKPEPATKLEPGEIDHDWPQFLEDGVRFLYAVTGRTITSNQVYLASLSTPERKLLLDGVQAFAYAPPGHLVFVRDGALVAQQLDVSRGALTGAPVVLAERAQAPFSASRTGALIFRSVPATPLPLVWIRPDGSVIGNALAPGYYTDPQVSPDGTQVALAAREEPSGPWHLAVLDIGTGASRRLGVRQASERAPVWSPDGRSIVYQSLRPDAPGLYRINANGVGVPELVLPSNGVVWPYQWTARGLAVFDGVSGNLDVAILSGDDLRKRTNLVVSPANDVDGAVSPDGRWFVYTSNETGRWELFMTTAEPSPTKLPVTTGGGCDPVWSPDGSIIYYTRTATAELMALPVVPGDPPTFGMPRRIHPGPLEYPSAHSIDIHPRGDRILIAPSEFVRGDITVLVNWQAALKR